ncbi:hypothetical protein VNO77_12720 [Canavalia gladiata]|uniref:Neprosin PEP catalytic domain-containing protein n=1 Tax=Canavalia gladiata TaxID=3824 RepID=A0AAN9QUJ6_CANGL
MRRLSRYNPKLISFMSHTLIPHANIASKTKANTSSSQDKKILLLLSSFWFRGETFAGVSITASRPNGKYHYIEGSVSTHQPQVGGGQLSGSVISVESGIPNSTFGVIRIGWMQFDHKSAKGCFNTYCPGFVQVNRKIPLDMVIDQISVPNGKYDFIKLELRQLHPGESWWFIYWDGDNEEHIGYWPNVLFNNLKDGAEVVRWGGWVSSTTANLPMMGSGLLGVHGGQVRRISATNDFTARLNGATKNREKYVYEQSKCYRAGPNRYRHPYWGDSVWYGGNAGDVKHCPP